MIEIVYEDKNLVVCIKPIGVHSENNGDNSLPALLSKQLGCEIYPVHRLDQVVSGLIVYGKNSDAAGKLSNQMSTDQFDKQYLAVAEGHFEKQEDTLVDLLYHDRNKNKSYVVDHKRANVKEAKLTYQLLEEKESLSLVRVKLYTGRTHQIRVQLSHIGHPLTGDGKYGSRKNKCATGLYSYQLSFNHPMKKQRLSFTSIPTHYPFSEFNLEKL